MIINIIITIRELYETLTTSSNSSEGEIGGLSDSAKFKGPLLCESLPDVNGDTSCKLKIRP